MRKTLFIRADGNSEIGMGHIMRSMTIASSFRKHGYRCVFLSSAPIAQETYDRYGYEVIELKYPYNQKSLEEALEIVDILKQNDVDYLLVDSYFIGNEYLSIIRDNITLICISSIRKKFSVDYLINENIACDRVYINELYAGSETKLLLGARYSPIREEFISRQFVIRKTVKSVLISTGGGDQYNFMTLFLRKIVKERLEYCFINFVFISGEFNSHHAELMDEASGVKNVRIVRNAGNMSELMLDSDIAISAGGMTILELSVMGVPSIGIAVSEDQIAGLTFMGNNDMIEYVGHISEMSFWDSLSLRLDELIRNYDKRVNLSNIASQHIDGNGAQRIFEEITGNRC